MCSQLNKNHKYNVNSERRGEIPNQVDIKKNNKWTLGYKPQDTYDMWTKWTGIGKKKRSISVAASPFSVSNTTDHTCSELQPANMKFKKYHWQNVYKNEQKFIRC